MAKKDDNSKICSALAYWLVGIIWYAVDDKIRKDELVKFHVKQGLVLLIVYVVLYIAGGMLTLITLGFFAPILLLLQLALLVLTIIGTVNGAGGKKKEVPIVGRYAKKFFRF